MSEVEDIIRLTKIIEGYENLIDYIFDESFFVLRSDIQAVGLDEAFQQVKLRVISEVVNDSETITESSLRLGLHRDSIRYLVRRYGLRAFTKGQIKKGIDKNIDKGQEVSSTLRRIG